MGSGVINIFRDWTVSMGLHSVGLYKLARLLLWLHTECRNVQVVVKDEVTDQCLLGNYFIVTPTIFHPRS